MVTRLTIRDLATECGVSPALVSKALKGKDGVGRDTREYIIKKSPCYGL